MADYRWIINYRTTSFFIVAALLSCDAVLGLAPLRYASDQPAAAHQTRSASLASASAPDVWDDGDCTGRPDNWSAADAASKCRRYYRCVAGKKSVYLCPAKNVFNGERCVPPAQHECAAASTTTAAAVSTTPTAVTAPPIESSSEIGVVRTDSDCEGRPDGYYADFNSGCRSYFFCSNGLKAVYVCTGNDVYDGSQCVDPFTYHCPTPKHSVANDCAGLGTGYFADVASGCRRYFYCREYHKLITLTCADQRIFNGRKCVDPTGGHQCTPPAAAEDVLGEPHGLESVQYAIGVGAGSGKYSPAYDVVATPSDGGAAAAAAASAAGGGCEHSNGFFVVAGTACQSYYFCIGGVRSDQHCPRHQVFNGEVCVPAGQFHCADDGAGASASSNSKNQPTLLPVFIDYDEDCLGKVDGGVYPDRQSQCRNYYLCQNGARTGNFTCPAGQAFDGQRCHDARHVSCDSTAAPVFNAAGSTAAVPAATAADTAETGECQDRRAGLYADTSQRSGGCRGYVYCRLNRRWAVSQCPASQRFSRQDSRCVPKHEVPCPDDH